MNPDTEPTAPSPAAELTAADVLELLEWFEQAAITCHIDGGWAVDALLGRQTRPHADLDIALPHAEAPRLRARLAAAGFVEIPRDDSWACNFVLQDPRGRQVDVHTYVFDAAGQPVYGIPYPLASLSGNGVINGRPVNCIAPAWLVQFHTGYPVDAQDYHDVKALCVHFGLAVPTDYARFEAEPPG